MDADAFYAWAFPEAVRLGPLCRRVGAVHRGRDEAVAEITPGDGEGRTVLDLGAVDACFQLLAALLPDGVPRAHLLTGMERLSVSGSGSGPLRCHARRVSFDPATAALTADLRLFDGDGRVLLEIEGARLEQAIPAPPEDAAPRPAPPGDGMVLLEVLAAAPGDRPAVLEAYVARELSAATGRPLEGIETDVPLLDQLDSLMAVELKTRMEAALRVPVPIAAFLQGNSIRELAGELAGRLEASAPALADPELLAAVLEGLEEMDEDEARALAGHAGAAEALP
jgi:hypothetical protein